MAKLFFSGIGGSGVSALASFMADMGHAVAGSDRSFDRNRDHPVSRILKANGIAILPQDGSGINESFDCAVFSTAVENNNPEFQKVKELGIPMKTRPQYLREIVSPFRTIAVAGTSGKSTIAGLLAYLMDRLEMQPNFIGGACVKQFRKEYSLGNSLVGASDLLIFEACESDGTIVDYSPSFAIIANLTLDHNPIGETAKMFETFGSKSKEKIIINADDENLAQCRFDKFDKTVTFSVKNDSLYRAEAVTYHPFSTLFRVHDVPFYLPLPGTHNLYNALAAIAALCELGIRLDDIASVMPDFSGIERRYDVHLYNDRYLVVDDYAHNPHKIASLMETVKKVRRKICYIFQPHGFGPVRRMKKEYIQAFADNLSADDCLLVLPIFYAGGTFINDVSSEDICEGIRATGKDAEVLPDRAMIFNRLSEWDTYIIFGARDESLSQFADAIAERLH